MAKSLRISFDADGARLKLDETVEGFDAVAQNGMVNIVTRKGSDSQSDKRGTDLLKNALQGRVADLLTAQHISNLAAINTLFYLRSTDESDTTEERVDAVILQAFEYDGASLKVNALFTGTAGSTVGTDVTIT